MKTKIIRFSRDFYLLILPLWIYIAAKIGIFEDSSISSFGWFLVSGVFLFLIFLTLRYALTIEVKDE